MAIPKTFHLMDTDFRRRLNEKLYFLRGCRANPITRRLLPKHWTYEKVKIPDGKYLVFTDLHASVSHLKAILEYCKENNIRHVIPLGDNIGRGPSPVETIEIFAKLASEEGYAGVHLVNLPQGSQSSHLASRGNHEDTFSGSNGKPRTPYAPSKSGKTLGMDYQLYSEREFLVASQETRAMKELLNDNLPYCAIAETSNGTTIHFAHFPFRSKMGKNAFADGTEEAITQIISRTPKWLRPDILFYGHIHSTSNFTHDGVQVVGPGSASGRSDDKAVEYTAAGEIPAYFSVVTIEGGQVDIDNKSIEVKAADFIKEVDRIPELRFRNAIRKCWNLPKETGLSLD